MELNKIIHGEALEQLKLLPDASVNCIVTSPPYWGLRDYSTSLWVGGDEKCPHNHSNTKSKRGLSKSTLQGSLDSQGHQQEGFIQFCSHCGAERINSGIGLESTLDLFIKKLVAVFEECRRIIKDDGTLWLNMGDSYSTNKKTPGVKPKDMFGQPWMLAFALREKGWFLRQDIIWSKPNPMPESASDRCTKSHEYLFLLTKSARYKYNAKSIATPYKDKTYTTYGIEPKGNGDGTGLVASENWANDIKVRKPKQWKTPDGWDTGEGSHGTIHREGREKGKVPSSQNFKRENSKRAEPIPGQKKGTHRPDLKDSAPDGLANKRSVWKVATKPFKKAHFATFPEALIIDCIKAGCPVGGIVLDPSLIRSLARAPQVW